jgi:hypothetical protein
MRSLDAVLELFAAKTPDIPLDHFQSRILGGLHLEFLLRDCRVLFTPNMRYLTTGEPTPEEEAKLQSVIEDRPDLLEGLGRYLVYNLSLYSALLETNSYLIALNNHLLISRFVGSAFGESILEVKLYTLSQQDLLAHYDDKIYLGRDFLSLELARRDHFGLGFLRESLKEQLGKLRVRLDKLLGKELRARIEREYLDGLDESIEEFRSLADGVLKHYPAEISSKTVGPEALLAINRSFREMKHVLMDMDETLRELEERLFKGRTTRAARYVTKLRKDVGNNVNYIMVKVNGRITDCVNGFRI